VKKLILFLSLFALLFSFQLSAQDLDSALTEAATEAATDSLSNLDFGLDLSFGFANLPSADNSEYISWQTMNFSPDLRLGEFGIGLDIDMRFRFNGGDSGTDFEIRELDWIPDDTHSFLDIYLPKIRYLSYGDKGDPLYVNLGEISQGTLGNGFLMSAYNNTLFSEEQRISGLLFDLDGALFNFPYLGFESIIGNFAAFDVLGFRIFARPGAGSEVPLLENLELGLSLAADTNPYYFDTDISDDGIDKFHLPTDFQSVVMYGFDILQPIISSDIFSLNLLGDIALQNSRLGSQLGVKGSIIKGIYYTALLRVHDSLFIPSYFDSTYDLFRTDKLAVYSADSTGSETVAGWLSSLGFSLLDGSLYFNASIAGPFEVDSSNIYLTPELKMSLGLEEGVLGGLSLIAYYEKKYILAWEDLIDPEYANIGAKLAYKLGPALISLVYSVSYDSSASPDPWVIQSKLETSIELF